MRKELIKKYLRDLLLLWVFINLTSIAFFIFAFRQSDITKLRILGLLEAEHILLLISGYCIAFYHFYVRKLLLKTGIVKAYINLLLVIAVYYLLDNICQNISISIREQRITFDFGLNSTFSRWVIATIYALFYALVKGIFLLRVRKLETERQNLDASLQNLRAQIEPHFIFNTLNYVYALSLQEKATKTSEAVEELSNLFRYTLRDSRVKTIPVEKELEFLEQYIHLNKIRIGESETITVNSSINWDKKQVSIAPLLVVNFIENAFKHGISVGKNSLISIDVNVADGRFELTVANTLHNLAAKNAGQLGLENTRKRLELLYPEKHDLTVTTANNVYRVHLVIRLQ